MERINDILVDAVVKGIVEQNDAGAYLGSTLSLRKLMCKAEHAGLLTANFAVSDMGMKYYKSHLEALNKTRHML